MGKYQAYPEYKDSGVEWLEDLPDHWEVKRTKAMFGLARQLVGKNSKNYQLLSLTLKGVIPRDISDGGGKIPAEFDTYQIVRPKNLIFCLFDIDETPRTIGISSHNGMITGAYNVYSALKPCVPEYAYYYFMHIDSFKGLKPFYTGLRKVVRSETFSNIKMPVPSKNEQQKIANFLDHETAKIDTLIEKQQQLIKLLKEKRQAVISHAVTKGLPSSTGSKAPMRDSGVEWLGEVPEHWEVSRVKYHCSVKGRIGFRGYTVEDLVDKEYGALVLGATEMNTVGDVVLNRPQYITWAKYFESPEIMLEEGMILVVQRGSTVGKVASISAGLGKATINPSLIVLRDLNISSKFMTYSLMGSLIKSLVDMERSSTAIPMISQEQVGNYWQLVPPEKEQVEIENHISEKIKIIDGAIDFSERSIFLMQ
jgi:type I restriction enzyme S subunit